MNRQPTLFDHARQTLTDSLAITAASLNTWGPKYDHWAIAFSGGKDSSATVSAVLWLIETGRVQRPKSLTILYADTRMELPPLHATAMDMLSELRARGCNTHVVLPPIEKRFFVYMFGRGVPPPGASFRWCTGQLKINPMIEALKTLREAHGKKLLMITGMRLGESAQRDARIAVSCSKNNSECGQGWFQQETPGSVADTLAPLLHWRLCHVWDWLMGFVPDGFEHGFSTKAIAQVYGADEDLETHARTGCVGCAVSSRDYALEEIIQRPQWQHFRPLTELRPLYMELREPAWRIRKDGTERTAGGALVHNPNRMGPLTMDARRMGLQRVLDIQARAGVDLINCEEENHILKLIADNTWPEKWTGNEPLAALPFEKVNPDGSAQPLMHALLNVDR